MNIPEGGEYVQVRVVGVTRGEWEYLRGDEYVQKMQGGYPPSQRWDLMGCIPNPWTWDLRYLSSPKHIGWQAGSVNHTRMLSCFKCKQWSSGLPVDRSVV